MESPCPPKDKEPSPRRSSRRQTSELQDSRSSNQDAVLPNTNPTCFVVNQLTSVVEGQQQTVLGRRRRKGEEEERRRRKIRRYTGNDGDGEECGCLALFSYPGRHCMKRQSASRQAQQLRRCVGGCVGAGGGACSRQAGHGESDAVCGAGTLIYRCPPHQHQTLTGA